MSILPTNDRSFTTCPATALTTVVAPPQPSLQLRRRERDFGIGYGNSSGYASEKRYASAWGQPRFRCI